MSVLRPLPPRPSLEHDRKAAKALLKRIRAGDVQALSRARERLSTIDDAAVERITLADAQLVIAREYGFTSWPRLVHYMRGVEHQHFHQTVHPPDFQESATRWLIDGHRNRRQRAGRSLAAYVPRFYGMRVDEVFSSDVTEDEARLAVARNNGLPSWEMLLQRAASDVRRRLPNEWDVEPLQRAGKAIQAADLHALQQVVVAHSELLHPTPFEISVGATLLAVALHAERSAGRDAMRPIFEWLAEHGHNRQRELNASLCRRTIMTADEVQALLDAGADPNWIAPNGIPVLEHALLRLASSEAADLIAARTMPRQALWISAGLGDVNGVHRFLDKHGKPTRAAYQLRPQFDVAGPFGIPSLPDPDDEEILMEAFWVAVMNQRVAVIEYMASRGFDVNCAIFGVPVINGAVGNGWTSVVECLVRCGADLDVHEGNSNGTARDMARSMWVNGSYGPRYRRIVELCGLDPDAMLAERDATPAPVPNIAEKLQEALELAEDDAFRHGQSDVRVENLLFGLLRCGGLPLLYFTQTSRMDRERFHTDVLERVCHGTERLDHNALPMHVEAQAMLDAATMFARARRRETVGGLELLRALVVDASGVASEILLRYEGNTEKLKEELARHH